MKSSQVHQRRSRMSGCEYETEGHCLLNGCLYDSSWWDPNDEPHGMPYCYRPDDEKEQEGWI